MYKIKNIYDIKHIEKKSIFYTKVFNVESDIDAKNIISDIKAKYNDADHYCYAYIINEYKKYNDDKEPFNTGKSLLDILEKNNINNTLCIVIRYFGGIKLGSSLKKAYTKGLLELIKNNLEEIKNYININITFNYDNELIINNILEDSNIINKIYGENITYMVEIEDIKYNYIINKLKKYIIN